jgi:hypothetical protein
VNGTPLSPAQQAGPPAPAEAQRPPQAATRPAGWTAGRIAAAVVGVLLVLASLVLLGAGGTGIWADLTQRHGGYVTTGSHEFSTSGSALVTEPTHLGSPGVAWLYSPGLLGKVRIRVTPLNTGRALFVGIGRSSDVDRYLAGVERTVIADFFGTKSETVAGSAPRSVPRAQHFWAASSTGPGARTLTWNPHGGSWTVVVMNADAKPGIGVRGDLGARMPAVLWIAIGLVLGGVVFLAGGGLVIAGAIRGRRVRSDHERRSHAEN